MTKGRRYDPSWVNDQLFLAFPAGWVAGVASGCVYGAYYWHDLQVEMGRMLVLSVSVSSLTTLGITMLITRSIFR